MSPLILTLRLDEASFLFFDTLRQRHFPPERNFLKAHLTLFHHLPDTAATRTIVSDSAAGTHPMTLEITGLMKLGNGVAYRVACPMLQQFHRHLQQLFSEVLIPQDRQPLRPHITIQNKVAAAAAASLYQELAPSFVPFTTQGLGADLWAYEMGPWRWLQYFPFAASTI